MLETAIRRLSVSASASASKWLVSSSQREQQGSRRRDVSGSLMGMAGCLADKGKNVPHLSCSRNASIEYFICLKAV